ncbi:MAG: T9SS type A sorting domain-containing protein [FCB group bacterium]|nr:T9SS type A sorting domain-containing protein [FCB group bacterium]
MSPKSNQTSNPAFPTPFNPSTTIRFELRSADQVTLKVYDIAGREAATLADGWYDSGHHTLEFNAAELSSGIYFVCLQAGEYCQTQKLVLVK